MSEEKIKTLYEIKKKNQSEKSKLAKQKNIQIALQKKKENFENKKKINKIESALDDVIGGESSEEETKLSSSEGIKEKKGKKNKNKGGNKEIETTLQNSNEIKNIYDYLNNINKKVDKLYTMKKMKKDKPIIIENNKNGNKEDVLNAIRNKMLNI